MCLTPPDPLHWKSESLTLRADGVFGVGWLFHEQQSVAELRLELRFTAGDSPCVLAVEHQRPRPDVGDAFPALAQAARSGYLVYGPCAGDWQAVSAIFLCGRLADGSDFEREIPPDHWRHGGAAAAPAATVRALWRQAGVLFGRGMYLLRQRQFRRLLDGARRYLSGRRARAVTDVDAVCALLSGPERVRVDLVFDHDLGGGANQYRRRMVAERVAQGTTVLVASYHVGTLSHLLTVHTGRFERRLAVPDLEFVRELVLRLGLHEIVYNTAVSFVRPERVPPLLVELKARGAARLLLLVHDFYMACPSHFLLNAQGVYCGVPDEAVCRRCLPANQQGFAALFAAHDIGQWRALWGMALAAADEIRAFSGNSRQLLRRAYPQLDEARITLLPHQPAPLPAAARQLVLPSQRAVLRIGVVGHIGHPKGAQVVAALSREIARRRLEVAIVVIGTIEAAGAPSVLRATGSYRHEQLPALIAEAGVNVMLFPSIVPETFSYVVQELMELNLPVACFDLGAPAERLAAYDKGRVLDTTEAAPLLDALLAFHRDLYPDQAGR